MRRIVEKGGLFYPQHRFLFWWFNYEDYYARTVCFDSLKRAKEFFNEVPPEKETIHKVP